MLIRGGLFESRLYKFKVIEDELGGRVSGIENGFPCISLDMQSCI
jgi:hypothetical protein